MYQSYNMPTPKSFKQGIQHAWTILSSGVSVDQDSNNLTLFNLIDQVVIHKNQLVEIPLVGGGKEPAAPIGFVIVSQWRKLKENTAIKGDVSVELLDPTGVMRQKIDYSVDLPEKIERLRSRLQWNGLRVTTSGVYTFRISLKEEGQKEFNPVGEAYLKVELLEGGSKKEKPKK